VPPKFIQRAVIARQRLGKLSQNLCESAHFTAPQRTEDIRKIKGFQARARECVLLSETQEVQAYASEK
jgi:hypothetical protein